MDRLRTLIGISVFWFGLAMLGDGFTTLVVPVRLAGIVEPAVLATVLGLVTFVGLLAGALVQPIAGAASDALYPRWGRRGMLVVGAALVVGALGAFVGASSVVAILLAFVLLQLAAGVAQAAQQGFIPDLVASDWRGRAAGAKGLADLGGAFVGFAVLGLLLAGGDVTPAVAAVGVAVIATAVVTVALVRERNRGPAATTPPLGKVMSLRASYRVDLRADGAFVRVVAARFLFLLATFAIGRFFLLLVADRLGRLALIAEIQ